MSQSTEPCRPCEADMMSRPEGGGCPATCPRCREYAVLIERIEKLGSQIKLAELLTFVREIDQLIRDAGLNRNEPLRVSENS